jgi:hypothetical protein
VASPGGIDGKSRSNFQSFSSISGWESEKATGARGNPALSKKMLDGGASEGVAASANRSAPSSIDDPLGTGICWEASDCPVRVRSILDCGCMVASQRTAALCHSTKSVRDSGAGRLWVKKKTW